MQTFERCKDYITENHHFLLDDISIHKVNKFRHVSCLKIFKQESFELLFLISFVHINLNHMSLSLKKISAVILCLFSLYTGYAQPKVSSPCKSLFHINDVTMKDANTAGFYSMFF